jgi:hypothetical protein
VPEVPEVPLTLLALLTPAKCQKCQTPLGLALALANRYEKTALDQTKKV